MKFLTFIILILFLFRSIKNVQGADSIISFKLFRGVKTPLICKVELTSTTTYKKKLLPCRNNSNFILEGDDFNDCVQLQLDCSFEKPLDLSLEFAHPSDDVELRSFLPAKANVELNSGTIVYFVYATEVYYFNRPVSSVSRFTVFNPMDSSFNHTINIYRRGPNAPDLIYNGTKKSVCDKGDDSPIDPLPCVSSRPDALPRLYIQSSQITTERLEISDFTYDAGLGFFCSNPANYASLIRSLGPNFYCETDAENRINNVQVHIVNGRLSPCNDLTSKLVEDFEGNFLECEINVRFRNTYYLDCKDKYNESTIGPDANFQISTAFSSNPIMAKTRLQIFSSSKVQEDNRRDFYFKKSKSYQTTALYDSGFGQFQSESHFINFQYLTDLEGHKRMVPRDYNTFNKSWVMRMTKFGPCPKNHTVIMEETADGHVYSAIEYCFQCKGTTYLVPRGLSWHFEYLNGTTQFLHHDGGDLVQGEEEVVYSLRTFINSTFKAVICSASFWNGDRINSSASFSVIDVQSPKILEKSTEPTVLDENDSRQSLICKASGTPLPKISWLQNNSKLTYGVETGVFNNLVESRIKFGSVRLDNSGEYICTAYNLGGDDQANFTVVVRPKPESTKTDYSVPIIISIIVGIAVFLSVGIIIIRKLEHIKNGLTRTEISNFKNGQTIKKDEIVGGQALAESIPYDEKTYELPESNFSIDTQRILGEGAFGVVYMATVNAEKAAAKMVRSHAHILALLAELKIMTYIGIHENIVTVVGAHTARLHRGKLTVFVEFCGFGSLQGYLRERKPNSDNMEDENRGNSNYENDKITTDDMKLWSFQIVKGMEYLALKKVVHGDLATRNVLLVDKFTAKISDFGLSRKLYEYTEYTKRNNQDPLPWRWMSIEALRSLSFSEKSDVWSFGVTMWEIFSFADVPYPGLSWSINFVTQLENNLRNEKPKHADQHFFQMMMDCWHLSPNDRPTFKDLKDRIARGRDSQERINCVYVDVV